MFHGAYYKRMRTENAPPIKDEWDLIWCSRVLDAHTSYCSLVLGHLLIALLCAVYCAPLMDGRAQLTCNIIRTYASREREKERHALLLSFWQKRINKWASLGPFDVFHHRRTDDDRPSDCRTWRVTNGYGTHTDTANPAADIIHNLRGHNWVHVLISAHTAGQGRQAVSLFEMMVLHYVWERLGVVLFLLLLL